MSPSPSGSSSASLGSFGSRPSLISSTSGIPSPSVSRDGCSNSVLVNTQSTSSIELKRHKPSADDWAVQSGSGGLHNPPPQPSPCPHVPATQSMSSVVHPSTQRSPDPHVHNAAPKHARISALQSGSSSQFAALQTLSSSQLVIVPAQSGSPGAGQPCAQMFPSEHNAVPVSSVLHCPFSSQNNPGVQSKSLKQFCPTVHFCEQMLPQFKSVPTHTSGCAHMPYWQNPDAQSLLSTQSSPLLHCCAQLPPQSMPVSPPFFIVSLQVLLLHVPFMHAPFKQSISERQTPPAGHGPHNP